VDQIITIVDPKPEPHPDRYLHTDVDGDRLLVTTAHVPDHGAGVYFRTDRQGSTILLADLPAFIAQLQVIADAAKADPDNPA
jgi:hypothetical protein